MKSYEERKKIVHYILFEQPGLLYDTPIKEGTLKNKTIEGCCTGFTFGLGNLSYRGIWISTIEDFKLTVDGEPVPKENMMLCLKGVKYPIDSLVRHSEIFWGATDECVLNVNRIGGLAVGEHTLELEVLKRQDFGHSYGEAEEGYDEAEELKTPECIRYKAVCTVA